MQAVLPTSNADEFIDRLKALEALMLEFDDIQHILLTRVPALTGRYEFLSFQQPAQARAWLEAIREKIPSARRSLIPSIWKTLGVRGVHLERVARTRRG